jgi:hypothetical protein
MTPITREHNLEVARCQHILRLGEKPHFHHFYDGDVRTEGEARIKVGWTTFSAEVVLDALWGLAQPDTLEHALIHELRKAKSAMEAAKGSNAIAVYRFHEAPEDLQALSQHGGDEDWLAVIPPGADEPLWADEGTAFGCCSVSRHEMTGGWLVLIGAHA